MVKIGGALLEVQFRKPTAVYEITTWEVLTSLISYRLATASSGDQKSTPIYDIPEIGVINAVTAMEEWRAANPGAIQRRSRYS